MSLRLLVLALLLRLRFLFFRRRHTPPRRRASLVLRARLLANTQRHPRAKRSELFLVSQICVVVSVCALVGWMSGPGWMRPVGCRSGRVGRLLLAFCLGLFVWFAPIVPGPGTSLVCAKLRLLWFVVVLFGLRLTRLPVVSVLRLRALTFWEKDWRVPPV